MSWRYVLTNGRVDISGSFNLCLTKYAVGANRQEKNHYEIGKDHMKVVPETSQIGIDISLVKSAITSNGGIGGRIRGIVAGTVRRSLCLGCP